MCVVVPHYHERFWQLLEQDIQIIDRDDLPRGDIQAACDDSLAEAVSGSICLEMSVEGNRALEGCIIDKK
jgi:hypothetical protein